MNRRPRPEAPGRKVEIATVVSAEIPRQTNLLASIVPLESIDLYARASGILERQVVRVGDRVKKGDLPATVNAPELIAEVDQARAKVSQAKARGRAGEGGRPARRGPATARADAAQVDAGRAAVTSGESRRAFGQKQAERIEGLRARNAVSNDVADGAKNQVDQARGTLTTAKSKLEASQANLDGSRARIVQVKAGVAAAQADLQAAEAALSKAVTLLQQTIIRSPIDGVVARQSFHVGDFIRSGDQAGVRPVLTVVRTDRVLLNVHVPQPDALLVKRGAPVTVRVSGIPGRQFAGKVAEVGYSLEVGLLGVGVEVDNSDGRLRPGLSGTAAIELDDRYSALVIPTSALLTVPAGPGDAQCYTVGGGRAVLTRITVGQVSGDRVEVVRGLKAGDRVVARPEKGLKDGQVIEPGETRRP